MPHPHLEVAEVTGGLVLLGELWGVELDRVHCHFTSCLFAAGLGDRGTEVGSASSVTYLLLLSIHVDLATGSTM